MSTEVQKFGENIVRVVHQPGNGTRYEVVGVKMPPDFPGNEDEWLISFPLNGTSHFFKAGGFTAVSYVAEKLGFQRNGSWLGEVDLHEMTKAITIITGGKHNAATDEKGYFSHLRVAR